MSDRVEIYSVCCSTLHNHFQHTAFIDTSYCGTLTQPYYEFEHPHCQCCSFSLSLNSIATRATAYHIPRTTVSTRLSRIRASMCTLHDHRYDRPLAHHTYIHIYVSCAAPDVDKHLFKSSNISYPSLLQSTCSRAYHALHYTTPTMYSPNYCRNHQSRPRLQHRARCSLAVTHNSSSCVPPVATVRATSFLTAQRYIQIPRPSSPTTAT